MLVSIGVSVTEGRNGILMCRMDEIRGEYTSNWMHEPPPNHLPSVTDPTGLLVVAKAVRFRVEPHVVGSHTAHALAGYVINMTMVQEKGALSSFKYVYNRLRREWELDSPLRAPNGTAQDTPTMAVAHMQFV